MGEGGLVIDEKKLAKLQSNKESLSLVEAVELAAMEFFQRNQQTQKQMGRNIKNDRVVGSPQQPPSLKQHHQLNRLESISEEGSRNNSDSANSLQSSNHLSEGGNADPVKGVDIMEERKAEKKNVMRKTQKQQRQQQHQQHQLPLNQNNDQWFFNVPLQQNNSYR